VIATISPTPAAVVRYFTDDKCVWKFEPGKLPMVRSTTRAEWGNSLFTGIEEFMVDSGPFWETTEEEGEP